MLMDPLSIWYSGSCKPADRGQCSTSWNSWCICCTTEELLGDDRCTDEALNDIVVVVVVVFVVVFVVIVVVVVFVVVIVVVVVAVVIYLCLMRIHDIQAY